MSDDLLFSRRVNPRNIRLRQSQHFEASVWKVRPEAVTLEVFGVGLAIVELSVEQLDDLMQMLKETRRSIRHHQFKQGGLTDDEWKRATQTDPQWAEKMLADPPQPVNETVEAADHAFEPSDDPGRCAACGDAASLHKALPANILPAAAAARHPMDPPPMAGPVERRVAAMRKDGWKV